MHSLNNLLCRKEFTPLVVNDYLNALELTMRNQGIEAYPYGAGARGELVDYERGEAKGVFRETCDENGVYRYDFSVSFLSEMLGCSRTKGIIRRYRLVDHTPTLKLWAYVPGINSGAGDPSVRYLNALKRVAKAMPRESRGFVVHTGGHHFVAVRGACFLETPSDEHRFKVVNSAEGSPRTQFMTQEKLEAFLLDMLSRRNGVVLVGEGNRTKVMEIIRSQRRSALTPEPAGQEKLVVSDSDEE